MRGHPARSARKAVLLASASIIVLAVASSDLRAADLALPVKAPPAPVVRDVWTWWAEGGFTGPPAGDPAVGLPPIGPFANVSPGPGWEAAIGFDYAPGNLSPYHISGQFRYGENNRGLAGFSGSPFAVELVNGFFHTPAVLVATGTDTIKEDHWLVDFAIGRDFALGSGNIQAKLGVRVAEITSSTSALGALTGCSPSLATCYTPVSGSFSFQSRSRFLGVGPRLGVDGSQPLGGSWAFDYLGGVAVLFGDRSFNATQSTSSLATPGGFFHYLPLTAAALATCTDVAVFNLDAQAGISYWLTRNFKLTASYRFDGYWNALTVIEPNGSLGNQSRFYYGPMLRATVTF
jgi:hypothetical protein